MTADALVSLLIGASVFDEGFHNAAFDLLGEAIGLALMLVAAVGLSRLVPGQPECPSSARPRWLVAHGDPFWHNRRRWRPGS